MEAHWSSDGIEWKIKTNNFIDDSQGRLFLTLVLVFAGYSLTIIATLVGKFLGLTFIDGKILMLIGFAVLPYTIITAVITYRTKNYSPSFDRTIYYTHFMLFIIVYGIWVYFLGPLRIMGIVAALIAVTFILIYTDLIRSLLLSFSTIIMQVAVSIFAISYRGQTGNLKYEILLTMLFLPSFLFIAFTSRILHRRNEELKKARKDIHRINQDLYKINTQLREVNRYESFDREIASTLQRSMLPKSPIQTENWDIAVSFEPHSGVSGDFYDFYLSDGKLTGMCLFDVSGHGLSAALISMIARPVFYRYFISRRKNSLTSVLKGADSEIFRELINTEMYMTGIVLRVNNSEIEYVNAGHPDILIRRNSHPEAVIKIGKDNMKYKGSPIGMLSCSKAPKTLKFSVRKGDSILLFTDCILETNDVYGVEYGYDRLIKSLSEAQGNTAEEILSSLVNKFNSIVD